MIRGAFILVVGFALGYGKAMSDQEVIRDLAQEIKDFIFVIEEQDKKSKSVHVDDFVDTTVVPDEPIGYPRGNDNE